MYLLDTYVWLERLLDLAGSSEVGTFLERIPSEDIYITDIVRKTPAEIVFSLP